MRKISDEILNQELQHDFKEGESEKAEEIKDIAYEMERLSWTRTDVDYQNIINLLPDLKKKTERL